jgi:hypothetical protein
MDEDINLPTDLPEDTAQGREDAIARLYVGLLGRAPDNVTGDNPEGLSFWVNELENRGDKSFEEALYDIAESIRVSAPDSEFSEFSAGARDVLNAGGLDELGSESEQTQKIGELVDQLATNVGVAGAVTTEQRDAAIDAIRTDLSNENGASIGQAVAQIHFLSGLPQDAADTVANRVDAATTFANNDNVQQRSAGSEAEVETVVDGGDFTQNVGADDDPEQAGNDAADNLPQPATDRNLDEEGGTQGSAADVDVADAPFDLVDSVGETSFTNVSGFGEDDSLTFTGDISADSDNFSVSSRGTDVIFQANVGGTVSNVTVEGVSSPDDLITGIDSFNALDVGNVVVGGEANDGGDGDTGNGDDGDTGNGDDGDTGNGDDGDTGNGDTGRDFDTTTPLDDEGGTQQSPASVDASDQAEQLVDDVSTTSVTNVSGFGADDGLQFNGITADSEQFSVSNSGADVIVSANVDGTLSRVTIEDVASAEDLITSVSAFNNLDVGDITFG